MKRATKIALLPGTSGVAGFDAIEREARVVHQAVGAGAHHRVGAGAVAA